ncbi:NADH dehydrogenase [ubiquinone] 1 subunit C1, mitochondrial [Anolis sagrei]|uniref:NADH dehydrogenase [ubiquinone] 1 subunit C1, mitochondrial n=1 Tax=Anolis sagrei TaxID=38937 RepID=UPI00295C1FA5|nr:NADH dehydrogenase [ubiquinone] 1 subunit C1, mitochondrial [Anolis sagrei ordinatus]
MAAPLQAVRRLLRSSGGLNPTFSRSAFTARKDDPNNPNWVKVGLSLGATAAIWMLIFKQHNEHLAEYERRKAEQGS